MGSFDVAGEGLLLRTKGWPACLLYKMYLAGRLWCTHQACNQVWRSAFLLSWSAYKHLYISILNLLKFVLLSLSYTIIVRSVATSYQDFRRTHNKSLGSWLWSSTKWSKQWPSVVFAWRRINYSTVQIFGLLNYHSILELIGLVTV